MKRRIGIVGGGQLGRMLAFEAKKLGFTVTVMDPTPDSPAGQVVDKQILGDYSDAQTTRKLASESDFVTVEIEHINTSTLQELAETGSIIHPSPQTISIIKDKYEQKRFLSQAHIPTAECIEVSSEEDIDKASRQFGYPLLLKAKHGAFDGRGNSLIKSKQDIAGALHTLKGRELYVEKYVPFVKELAVMVARSTAGEIVSYPVVETIHRNNICHMVIAPAPIDRILQKRAQRLAVTVMEHLKGAGVFGIEMFLTQDDKLLINEIAPRVHNSGHYTIEACVTSQFEQHIRAITGLPLGATDMRVPAAVMVNILGKRSGTAQVEGLESLLKHADLHVHLYGKSETKPERKMGHITVIRDTIDEARRLAERALKVITI